jgi:limonene-1,2-epoxide hydrolase
MTDTSPHVSTTNGQVDTSPAKVARHFLELLQDGDIDGAAGLLAEDVQYINVSLPTIRGRERVRRALTAAMARVPGAGFEVYFHAVCADGGTVMTERTDVIRAGPVRIQIWVCGRFDVRDGHIELWRDYFDWWNVTVATMRGVLGAVIPSLRPQLPAAR